MTTLDITGELLKKYGASGPRYTSYPAIPYWGDATPSMVEGWLESMESRNNSVSLYTHIPFCKSRCYYCGCFVVITPHTEQAERYVDGVMKEMELVAGRIKHPLPVRQYHLGGGTPNYLPPETMTRMVRRAKELFPFMPDTEMSIEVDPRTLDEAYLPMLRELGFNRMSFGVQDFDPKVQEAVNRIQPYDMVARVTEQARQLGFLSVNFDLIYGLPEQTGESFGATMDQVKVLRPDRVALYHYAHLPDSHPYQRRFAAESMADSQQKMAIFLAARQAFLQWGYQPIGLDHFALPEDDLSTAFKQGTMQRNFMGYSTQAGTDMLSFGISAISDFNHAFWQNEKKLPAYYDSVENNRLPILRGLDLNPDDRLRKSVIQALFCKGVVAFAEVEKSFGVSSGHFSEELKSLASMSDDGLVVVTPDRLEVTERGQLFLRNIAMKFDAYLKQGVKPPVQFSSTV
ncbi:MAG: oxygen-independent coproporphyrinogen III oxidase [Deltaproteobacteria bacterium]|nr:oxygen-independent coproporphyrinogen III oxidase [Deltaproteobacteria bacterium]